MKDYVCFLMLFVHCPAVRLQMLCFSVVITQPPEEARGGLSVKGTVYPLPCSERSPPISPAVCQLMFPISVVMFREQTILLPISTQ